MLHFTFGRFNIIIICTVCVVMPLFLTTRLFYTHTGILPGNFIWTGKSRRPYYPEALYQKFNVSDGDGYDPKLLLRYKLEHPARGEEYQLDNPNTNTSTAQNAPMLSYVQNILRMNGVEKGFFIESGAHDGEYLSNTLDLEMDFGWSGLLIEPDPVSYSRLLTRKRKCWTTSVCLSTRNSEQTVKFHVHSQYRVLGRIENKQTKYKWDSEQLEEFSVQCVPLADLLFAIRVSSVDYFSLDIEGNELDVLKTIPFDKILIKVLTVENNLIPEGKESLNTFMRSQNYSLIDHTKYMSKEAIRKTDATDSVYVHRSLTVNDVNDTKRLISSVRHDRFSDRATRM